MISVAILDHYIKFVDQKYGGRVLITLVYAWYTAPANFPGKANYWSV